MSSLHYIVDECGNYYRINGNNQLVVAGSREKAGVFNFNEAIDRIGGGKKGHFYSTIPVEEHEEENNETLSANTKQNIHPMPDLEDAYYSDEEQDDASLYEGDIKMSLPYDMKRINWIEYLTHFCYIASSINNYQDELNQALSNIDMQICDIMHYIELYNMNEDDSIRMIKLMKELREQRRDVKDEMVCIDNFERAIGTSNNIVKVKDSIKQIKKLSTRKYHPRKLQALFADCPEKTIRDSKLTQIMENNTCLDIEKEHKGNIDVGQEKEEGVIMEYTKKKTVFDGKINNWMEFAKKQAEFYSNVGQYIYNLQIDMKEIDDEIEQTLNEIENANYNAAQGYKVFKHLKELRNVKNEKQKELDCLYILTESFDCGAMANAMEACVNEIEPVLAEPEQVEKGTGIALVG